MSSMRNAVMGQHVITILYIFAVIFTSGRASGNLGFYHHLTNLAANHAPAHQ